MEVNHTFEYERCQNVFPRNELWVRPESDSSCNVKRRKAKLYSQAGVSSLRQFSSLFTHLCI